MKIQKMNVSAAKLAALTKSARNYDTLNFEIKNN